MNDVIDRLAGLRSEPITDPAVVADDVRRGRRALTRRRMARGATAGVCALAVGGVVAGIVAQQPPADTGLDLVAYDGPQLPGFTVDKVPEGYVLQGATAYNLNIAKPGDTSRLDVFEEKLVVMLETVEADVPTPSGDDCGGVVERKGDKVILRRNDGTVAEAIRDGDTWVAPTDDCNGAADRPAAVIEPFDVDGDAAKITTNSEGTRTLRYEHGDYRVVVQLWPTLKLSNAELVEFADGLSVTGAAKPSLG